MKNTLSRVSFIVHENQKFQVSDRLLCTISGGQDSILNLTLLYNIEVLYLFQINLTYCNHFWQPTNFYTLFELFKFGYLINKPITNLVPKKRLLSEEEAHFWRQNNFYQIATYLSLNNIILGHSLSDQIETSFWHFIRGSGPNGLISLKQNSFLTTKNFKKVLAKPCSKPKFYTNKIKIFGANNKQNQYFFNINLQTYAFPYLQTEIISQKPCCRRKLTQRITYYPENKYITRKKSRLLNTFKLNTVPQQYIYCVLIKKKIRIKVRRPLLGFSRTTISQFIKQNKLPRIIDTTNQSKKLIRNKLRLLILPLLKSSLQLKFYGNITKYLNIVEEEQIYFSILENQLIKIYLNNPLALTSFSRVPIAIKRYIVKTILDNYMSSQVVMNYITHIMNFKD